MIHRKAKGEKVAHNKTKTDVKMAPRLLAHMKRWERLDQGIRWWVHYNGKPITRIEQGVAKLLQGCRPRSRRGGAAHAAPHPGHLAGACRRRPSSGRRIARHDGRAVRATYCHVDPDFQKDAANASLSRERSSEARPGAICGGLFLHCCRRPEKPRLAPKTLPLFCKQKARFPIESRRNPGGSPVTKIR